MILYVTRVHAELVLVQVFVKTESTVYLDHLLVTDPDLGTQLLLLAALGAPEPPTVGGAVDLECRPPVVYFDNSTTPQDCLFLPLTSFDNKEQAQPVAVRPELYQGLLSCRNIGGFAFQPLGVHELAPRTNAWKLVPTSQFPNIGYTQPAQAGFRAPYICSTHTFLVSLARSISEHLCKPGVTS